MNIDKYALYENSEDFFNLNGSNWMRLTREAAQKVCKQSIDKNLIITWVDGGIWHFPGFEPRDAVWYSQKNTIGSLEDLKRNNLSALKSINDEMIEINVFIIGLQSITYN
jgi:hypothetical protein